MPGAPTDLSKSEAEAILGAGLALMAVQHVDGAGWLPSRALGRRHGQAAMGNARAVGLPVGVCLWLDLEGVASGTPASDVTDYCDAWREQVTVADYYRAGLYVGATCGLTGSQLDDLKFPYYWRSGSTVPTVTPGYCMVQSISDGSTLEGVAYDGDTTASGGGSAPVAMPFWLAPPEGNLDG